METKIMTGFGKAAALVAVLALVLAGGLAFPGPKQALATECWLTAAPLTITKGESSTISWSKHNADERLTIDNGIGRVGDGRTSGTVTVRPEKTTTYTGTNTNASGTRSMQCSVTIKVVEPAPKPLECTMTASQTSIVKGDSATVSWTSKNAQSAVLNPGNSAIATNGSVSVSPQVSTTYTGTFTGEYGKTINCDVRITVTEPTPEPVLRCEMSISPATVAKDATATLTWSSDDAVSASIDHAVGTVDVDGSRSVTVSSDTTYTGTFTDANGKTINCTASVRIETDNGGTGGTGGTGGSGRCLNCGEDDDDDDHRSKKVNPSIVLSKNFEAAPARYVTLTEVPYTGFEAGPVMTALFWLSVVAASAGIAYVVTYANPLAKPATAASASGTSRIEDEREHAPIVKSVAPTVPAGSPFANPTRMAEANAPGTSSAEDAIEEAAHTERVLLSPEALRLIATEAGRSSETLDHYLRTFFGETKTHYEPEDGWILLSKERANAIMLALRSPSMPSHAVAEAKPEVTAPAKPEAAKAPVAPVREAPASAPTFTAARSAQPASVPAFITLLSSRKEEEAYTMLRDLNAKDNTATQFIGEAVRALDDVYKHRIEGNHSPNAEVAAAVATLSNPELEKVIGMLVESVDYSYTSNRIGTKVALAKVFEYFANKK